MTFCSRVVLLTVPAHMSPSAVGETAGIWLELNTDFPALVVDGGQLGADAPGNGALLLLSVQILYDRAPYKCWIFIVYCIVIIVYL